MARQDTSYGFYRRLLLALFFLGLLALSLMAACGSEGTTVGDQSWRKIPDIALIEMPSILQLENEDFPLTLIVEREPCELYLPKAQLYKFDVKTGEKDPVELYQRELSRSDYRCGERFTLQMPVLMTEPGTYEYEFTVIDLPPEAGFRRKSDPERFTQHAQ